MPSPGVMLTAAAASVVAGAEAEASEELPELESSSLPHAARIKSAAAATATARVNVVFFIEGALPRVPRSAPASIRLETASRRLVDESGKPVHSGLNLS